MNHRSRTVGSDGTAARRCVAVALGYGGASSLTDLSKI